MADKKINYQYDLNGNTYKESYDSTKEYAYDDAMMDLLNKLNLKILLSGYVGKYKGNNMDELYAKALTEYGVTNIRPA